MKRLVCFLGTLALCASPLLLACEPSAHSMRVKPTAPPPAPILPPTESEAWRKQQPVSGSSGQVEIPAPQVRLLENGMTLYTLWRKTGIVSLSVVVRHGAEATVPGKSGLAALVARMLTESTRRRNTFQLAEAAENFGSVLQAGAQRDLIEVSLESLPGDTVQAVELLAEVVREPAFSSKDFERVRSQWLDDLLAERQSPTSLAALVGVRAMFGAFRGAPVNGGVGDVKKLALADLKNWHARYVTPSSAALVAAGPIDPETFMAAAQRAFGNWHAAPPTESRVEYSSAVPSSHNVIVVDRKGAVQSALFAAQPFPRRTEGGHEARLILNDILGGLFTSRINMNLRETHAYTYGAHSSVVANRNFGAFLVQTSVRTDATAASLKELILELSAVGSTKDSRPITADESTRARADLEHRLGARLEQNRYLVGDLETIFAEGLSADYYVGLPMIYAHLSVEDVEKQAVHIRADQLTIVIVGDREKIAPVLTQSGFTVKAPESEWVD